MCVCCFNESFGPTGSIPEAGTRTAAAESCAIVVFSSIELQVFCVVAWCAGGRDLKVRHKENVKPDFIYWLN